MNPTATDAKILEVVEHWVALLAQEDCERAFALARHDACHGWAPKLIEAVINGHGLPESHPGGEVFKVADPRIAEGGGSKSRGRA